MSKSRLKKDIQINCSGKTNKNPNLTSYFPECLGEVGGKKDKSLHLQIWQQKTATSKLPAGTMG